MRWWTLQGYCTESLKGVKQVIKTKMRTNTSKHIESELFDYHQTLKRIKQRRDELLSDAPKEEGMPSSPTLPSSTTEKYATRLVMDRQLQELERIARAIEHVYNVCDKERKDLIQLKYWTKPQTKTWDGIALELSVSKRQLYRWKDEIIQAVGEMLGWH